MKKTILTIVCTILICTCVMGTTLAYLVDKTDPIKNTFTVGDINIELKETKGEGTDYAKSFKMIPGSTLAKDPIITLKAGSEPCYIFVKIEKSENFDNFMTYVIYGDSVWQKIESGTNYDVYYTTSNSIPNADVTYQILAGDGENATGVVKVKSTVTKVDLNTLTDATYPTLTFTAYAVQFANLTSAQAWEEANIAANYTASNP